MNTLFRRFHASLRTQQVSAIRTSLRTNVHRQSRPAYSTSNRSEPLADAAAGASRKQQHIPVSRAFAAAFSVSFAAFCLGSLYPPTFAELISPRPAPAPPSDVNSAESQTYTAALEEKLQTLPFLRSLREAQDADEWYETRPYVRYPEAQRVNSLTAGALRGPGRLAVSPLLRVRRDESECVAILHLGRGLCGHDGIVHGGLIATIMDEGMGRTSIMNFPEKIAVTANLYIEYKAPTRADQFVVMRTKVISIEGRKAVVEGRLEDLDGKLLATGKSLFIQPKYAKLLNQSAIKQILGEPPVGATASPILSTPGSPAEKM